MGFFRRADQSLLQEKVMSQMSREEAPRIDKWLWAVRIYKTRSQASQACRTGKVKVDGQAVKPSREVQPDMIIHVHWGPINRILKVKALLKNRVGAKLVSEYMEDRTPEEDYKTLELIRKRTGHRPHGTGRPTKKERRDLNQWYDNWD